MKNSKNLDLTEGSILKNMLLLSLPIMLSNFLQTFYNLTDAFWLGKLGDEARNAVSVAGLAFPLVFFMSSFGFGFVVSGTSLISQYKGAKRYDEIKEVVGQFVLILVLFCFLFVFSGLYFLEEILKLLNTPPEIFPMAMDYIYIIFAGMIFMFTFLIYQSISHGLGDTISPMKVQLISVSVNVILDPLMIFGIGFFPTMGVKGAAYATLIARIITAITAVYFMFSKNKNILPGWKELKPNGEMLKKIFAISIPASLSQSMTSFGFLILQGFVNSYGTVAISIYSIGNRMTGFFMMPAMGISNALASVVGQNLGANKIARAEKSVSTAMKLVLAIMTTGCFVLFFFGGELTRFFIDDPEIIEAGKRMFRVTSIASNIFGVMFVFTGVFNGSGHTKASMKFNIARLWLFRIPMVYLLSGYIMKFSFFNFDFLRNFVEKIAAPLSEYPYDSLWWSMIFSNTIASIWAYLIYRKGDWKKSRI